MSQELEKEEQEARQETPEKAEDVSKETDAGETEADKETAQEEEKTESAGEENGSGEQEESEEDNSKEGEEKEKSGFFGKKKKKDKRDEQIEELTDRIKRTMAEFENFRKRNEREKTHMYEIGARDIIEKMLPVMDNFERGLQSIPEDQKDNAVAQGMEMIYKQMVSAFEEIGVKTIEAVGKEFDPNFHNAVMHEDNEEVGENIITEEFQKGYMYKESVVRHSMVKVAN